MGPLLRIARDDPTSLTRLRQIIRVKRLVALVYAVFGAAPFRKFSQLRQANW
jgi:hypothetical protein